jgi:hypothetical protein
MTALFVVGRTREGEITSVTGESNVSNGIVARLGCRDIAGEHLRNSSRAFRSGYSWKDTFAARAAHLCLLGVTEYFG